MELREILAIREQLKNLPAPVQAILDAASRLHRPIDSLSLQDIETAQ